VLESVCIRATCSEGALGVLGMTAEKESNRSAAPHQGAAP
jgi:hypothetical protein